MASCNVMQWCYFNQLGIGLIVNRVVVFSGDDLELPVVNTVPFTGVA